MLHTFVNFSQTAWNSYHGKVIPQTTIKSYITAHFSKTSSTTTYVNFSAHTYLQTVHEANCLDLDVDRQMTANDSVRYQWGNPTTTATSSLSLATVARVSSSTASSSFQFPPIKENHGISPPLKLFSWWNLVVSKCWTSLALLSKRNSIFESNDTAVFLQSTFDKFSTVF